MIAFYNQVFVPSMKAFLLRSDAPPSPGGALATAATAESGRAGRSAAASPVPTGAFAQPGPLSGLPPLPPRGLGAVSPRANPRLPQLSGAARGVAERQAMGRGSRGLESDADYAFAPPSQAGTRANGAAHSPMRSEGRTRVAAPRRGAAAPPPPVEHRIPEGLAALLQVRAAASTAGLLGNASSAVCGL